MANGTGKLGALRVTQPIKTDFGAIALQAGQAAMQIKEQKLKTEMLSEKRKQAERNASQKAYKDLMSQMDKARKATSEIGTYELHGFNNELSSFFIRKSQPDVASYQTRLLDRGLSIDERNRVYSSIDKMKQNVGNYNKWGEGLKTVFSEMLLSDKDGNPKYDPDMNMETMNIINDAKISLGRGGFIEDGNKIRTKDGKVEFEYKGDAGYHIRVKDGKGGYFYDNTMEGMEGFLRGTLKPNINLPSILGNFGSNVKFDKDEMIIEDVDGNWKKATYSVRHSSVKSLNDEFDAKFGRRDAEGNISWDMNNPAARKMFTLGNGMTYEERREMESQRAFEKYSSDTFKNWEDSDEGKAQIKQSTATNLFEDVRGVAVGNPSKIGSVLTKAKLDSGVIPLNNPIFNDYKFLKGTNTILIRGKSGDRLSPYIRYDMNDPQKRTSFLRMVSDAANSRPGVKKMDVNEILPMFEGMDLSQQSDRYTVTERYLEVNDAIQNEMAEIERLHGDALEGYRASDGDVESALTKTVQFLEEAGYTVDVDTNMKTKRGTNTMTVTKDGKKIVNIIQKGEKSDRKFLKAVMKDISGLIDEYPELTAEKDIEPSYKTAEATKQDKGKEGTLFIKK